MPIYKIRNKEELVNHRPVSLFVGYVRKLSRNNGRIAWIEKE